MNEGLLFKCLVCKNICASENIKNRYVCNKEEGERMKTDAGTALLIFTSESYGCQDGL